MRVEFLRCNNSTHNTHQAIKADGDAVAGSAVSGGEDFRGIGVEAAVVDVLEMNVISNRIVNELSRARLHEKEEGSMEAVDCEQRKGQGAA